MAKTLYRLEHERAMEMDIDSVKLVYFSPTRTTKKVVEAIAEGTRYEPTTHLDLTPPSAETMELEECFNELAIIGAPVYGGRIPEDAVSRLRRLKAHGTPAVIVVVYGNREYDDALLELRDLAVEIGFRVLAGAAFIGEHSYGTKEKPTALGRPDADDIEKAQAFGKGVQEKVEGITTREDIQPIQVRGNFPYKVLGKRGNELAPVTREGLCIKCGRCAEVCPKAAITIGETVDTDPYLCIFCTACVKNCPANARVWEDPRIIRAAEWLHTNFSERKEPETYLR